MKMKMVWCLVVIVTADMFPVKVESVDGYGRDLDYLRIPTRYGLIAESLEPVFFIELPKPANSPSLKGVGRSIDCFCKADLQKYMSVEQYRYQEKERIIMRNWMNQRAFLNMWYNHKVLNYRYTSMQQWYGV